MVLTRSMATTNNVQGDEPPRSTALERQVQTLMAAMERLTKQNHDLEEQLRQRDAGHDVQKESQGDSFDRGGPERPEGNNEPSRPERQNLSMPSLMDECQKTFEDLKKYLSSPPLLKPSRPGEELYLYIAVSQVAVSVALVREEEGSQRLVYFISRAFQGAEERYPRMEKLAFALVMAVRKLKLYFQAHTIIVLTD